MGYYGQNFYKTAFNLLLTFVVTFEVTNARICQDKVQFCTYNWFLAVCKLIF